MRRSLVAVILAVFVNVALAENPNNKYTSTVINSLDTIVFDMCNLVPKGDTIFIPISFSVNDPVQDTVDALGFTIKFDTSKVAYQSFINLKPSYLFATINPNLPFKVLKFDSFNTGPSGVHYDNNTPLGKLVFISKTGKMGAGDVISITLPILNGDASSYKLIDTTCVSVRVGMNEMIDERSLKIYPNPAVKETFIKFKNEENTKMNISLYDILGSKVKDIYNGVATAGDLQFKVETANLNPGIYFVNISTARSTYTRRLIVAG